MEAVGGTEDTGAMSTLPPCQNIDIALSLMQLIRDRDTPGDLSPAAIRLGDACSRPSIGSVTDEDGSPSFFCENHVRKQRLVLD
jgi:hypothetical protein